MTFSIVAWSERGGPSVGASWGVAVASKFLAVGAAVPAAEAGVGAIATQAYANTSYKRRGLTALAEGQPAEQVLRFLLDADEGRDDRQLGIVDAHGNGATFTGSGCYSWAGGRAGAGYAIQGNILTGPEVVDAMESAWLRSDDSAPLAARLLTALGAGDSAGGDSRGRQSAALLVVSASAGYGGFDDVAVDLRVDDHLQPVLELARLLDLNDLYLTASTVDERVVVTPELRDELEKRAIALGHRDFTAWVGSENYEMRVDDDLAWIDERVLGIIRGTASER
jgi:uncharacterized Ntn-hydrolase superfamily protein